ncbi:MAG: DUF4335 domain-containing protein [Aphanocapsa sp. GSE-SYN-MK-11-07L]|jgi:hypothetical protein|nr:DUF4335 domain-containing protein [Aphanocapsa sp. GSE-SYN-MK-11-07L]
MPIQRQYSLPNSTLVLEGLSNQTEAGLRPPLDVLIRFECHLLGLPAPLVGGKDLLEGLLQSVSHGVQEALSGVHRLRSARSLPEQKGIQVQPVAAEAYQVQIPLGLLLQPLATPTDAVPDHQNEPAAAAEFQLSQVQMFDLMEALDQLCADSQTLPDLVLPLQSLPRRSAAIGEPLTKQARAVSLGAGSLAVAATIFFFLPVPEVRRPEPKPPTPQETSSPSQTEASPSPPSPQPNLP